MPDGLYRKIPKTGVGLVENVVDLDACPGVLLWFSRRVISSEEKRYFQHHRKQRRKRQRGMEGLLGVRSARKSHAESSVSGRFCMHKPALTVAARGRFQIDA